MDWKEFILAHEADDLTRLVLSREKYPGVDVPLAASTIECRRKLKEKVPFWYAVPELVLPRRLSAEQCSSSATASYKAGLALRAVGKSGRIADLTGGLGVDSFAFSQCLEEVLYNEMDAVLADAARTNFPLLGARNIRFSCARVGETPLPGILGGFEPDILFLDPARRDGAGKKVFLLEDCSPDVTALLPELFAAAPLLMLKLSPMADIAMLLHRLPGVKEVHVLSSKGECKELLLLLERGWEGGCEIIAAEADGECFRFRREEEAAAVPAYGVPAPGDVLFEPGKALAKAGCFNLLSERFGMPVVGSGSHLYIVSGECPLKGLGKCFRVREVLPLDKRGIAAAGAAYPDADVSARGVKVSSDELARRLRMQKRKAFSSRSGNMHLFAVRADGSGASLLLVSTPEK